jgi:regulator of protease activity HflC (stomatin/prohibitin superfamily)
MSLFTPGLFTTVAILVLVIFLLSAALRILKEYERGVIFRLGRIINAKGPGLIILIPIVDKMLKVSLRLVAMDVDPQDVITRDNVSVKVNAVIYFRVIEPSEQRRLDQTFKINLKRRFYHGRKTELQRIGTKK